MHKLKKCLRCSKYKPREKFSKDRRRKDHLQKYCKICCKKLHKTNYKKNKLRIKARISKYRKQKWTKYMNSKYKNNYGITYEEKKQMLGWQKGRCAVCRKKLSLRNAKLDHDHSNGVLRMLLCNGCNTGIGITDCSNLLIAKTNYILSFLS